MNVLLQYLRLKHNLKSLKGSPPRGYKNNTVVYVVRLMNHKENLPDDQNVWMGNSKPCSNCQKYLSRFNIKRVKYTDIIDGVNVLCELELNI